MVNNRFGLFPIFFLLNVKLMRIRSGRGEMNDEFYTVGCLFDSNSHWNALQYVCKFDKLSYHCQYRCTYHVWGR